MHKTFLAPFIVVLVLAIVGSAAAAEVRKWTTRDGKHTIEAELVDFEDGKVTLKRADGKVVSVVLDRLSLEDHAYVKKSLGSLGFEVPTTEAAKSPTEPPVASSPAPMATAEAPPAPMPSTTTEPAVPEPAKPKGPAPASTWKEPPLTTDDGGAWQVQPDPAGISFDIPEDAKISVPLPGYDPYLIYPAAPVPFVGVMGATSQPYSLVDLRTNQNLGKLSEGINFMIGKAVSPDGKRFAFNERSDDRIIQIWSFETGKIETKLPPASPTSNIRRLEFAGPDRLIAWQDAEKILIVWDLRTEEIVAKIPHDSREQKTFAISPGGAYIALGKPKQKVIDIFDTRNGLLAGSLLTATTTKLLEPLEGVAFSHDGSELAAVYTQFGKASLHCWNLKNSEQVVHHEIKDVSNADLVVGPPLSWFDDGSGWQLNAEVTIDRKLGGPIIREKTVPYNHRFPNRYVNGQRMFQIVVINKRPHLELVPMPTHTTAEVQKFVKSGGEMADFGLPKLTKVADKAPRQLILDSGWTYQPAAVTLPAKISTEPLPLGFNSIHLAVLELSRPDVAIAAVGNYDRTLLTPERSAKRVGNGLNVFSRYDLVQRKQLSRVNIPYTVRLLDLSQDGKLGAMVIEDQADRLDIYDLSSGEHIVGFRPYGAATTGQRPDDKIA